MRKRLSQLFPIVLLTLALTLSGCFGGNDEAPTEPTNQQNNNDENLPRSDIATLNAIAGQWLSWEANSYGDQIMVNFTGEQFSVERYRNTGGEGNSYLVGQGGFVAINSTIDFAFSNGQTINSTLQINAEQDQLYIDEFLYYRYIPEEAPAAAGTISGQIIIDDGLETLSSSSAGIGAQSTGGSYQDNFIPGEILVQSTGGGAVERVTIEGDRELDLAVQNSNGFNNTVNALSVYQDDLKARTHDAYNDCKNDPTRNCAYNGKLRTASVSVPSDPLFDEQWSMRMINAVGAWMIEEQLSNANALQTVNVAVIDTGIVSHRDLDAHVGSGYDFITNPDDAMDGDGPDADPTDPGDQPNNNNDSWHGTHVAGIIGAVHNSFDIAGMTEAVNIVPLRALGRHGNGTFADIIAAIDYAVNTANVDIINLSIGCVALPNGVSGNGMPVCPSDINDAGHPLKVAVEGAVNSGVVVVAAAGNCDVAPEHCSEDFYPAKYEGVLAISGMSDSGVLAELSMRGSHIFLSSPAGNVGPNGVMSLVLNGSQSLSGTSQATPHVTGTIAAMLAANPSLSLSQIKIMLRDSAIDIGDIGRDSDYGHGLLNAGGALRLAAQSNASFTGTGASELFISETDLDFGYTKQHTRVFGYNVGNGTIGSIQVSSSHNWLLAAASDTVAPVGINVFVDRSSLSAGDHQGTVTISTSAGSYDINVSVSVLDDVGGGDGDGDGDGTGNSEWDDFLSRLEELLNSLNNNDDDTADDDGDGIPNVDDDDDDGDGVLDVDEPAGAPDGDDDVTTNTTDLGIMKVLLIDLNTNSVVAGGSTSLANDYKFNFYGIPDGDYVILSGKTDDLGIVCNLQDSPDLPCTTLGGDLDNPEVITITNGSSRGDLKLHL